MRIHNHSYNTKHTYKEWNNANGHLYMETNLVNDEEHGIHREWDGYRLYAESNLVNGELKGLYKEWDEKIGLYFEYNYPI